MSYTISYIAHRIRHHIRCRMRCPFLLPLRFIQPVLPHLLRACASGFQLPSMGIPFFCMQLSGVREIGSNVLKNTRETSLWEDLFSIWPVGHRVHEKNSCGRANQTSSPPVMSKSVNGSKSSNGSTRKGYGATRAKVSCHTTVKTGGQHRISYMTSHTTSYTTSYTISYTIWHTMCRVICPGSPGAYHWDFWSRNKRRYAAEDRRVRYRIRYRMSISYTISCI